MTERAFGEKTDGSEADRPGDDARSDAPDGEPSDGEVVRAVLDGETARYRVLVRRYEDVLFRHAVRMLGRPDDAADVVQEALVKGYRNLDACRHPEKVGGWLFRIASNLCKDRLKSPRQDSVSLEDGPSLTSGRGDPDRELARKELGDVLDEALEQLSVDQREAFLMKHLEGRSYTEMAEMLDVSVSALKMRVHRAREELQELLEPYR